MQNPTWSRFPQVRQKPGREQVTGPHTFNLCVLTRRLKTWGLMAVAEQSAQRSQDNFAPRALLPWSAGRSSVGEVAAPPLERCLTQHPEVLDDLGERGAGAKD